MYPTVQLTMFGWIPFVILLFHILHPRRAVIVAFLASWMFLPNYTYEIRGLPDYDKVTAASLGVLLGIFLKDRKILLSYKFKFYDFVMIAWFVTPLASSLSNGLGLYDGLSASKNYIVSWGIPYFIGRLYFTDINSIKELALGVFYGGIVYIPLCIIEILVSPQLHNWIYGWHPHQFLQSIRGNTYRPVVFMKHGLMLGMWMSSACIIGICLWRAGVLKKALSFQPIPSHLILLTLIGTTILCKSMGAIFLMLLSIILIPMMLKFRSKTPIIILLCIPSLYMYMRSGELWNGENLVQTISRYDPLRAESLEFRFTNEDILIEKALQRPMFGWGGWGRSRVYDDRGKDISVTDGYWIIVLGKTGKIGLAVFYMIIALPVIYLLIYYPPKQWSREKYYLVSPIFFILTIYLTDSLLNDMKNPIYMLIAGSLISSLTYFSKLQKDDSSEIIDKISTESKIQTRIM